MDNNEPDTNPFEHIFIEDNQRVQPTPLASTDKFERLSACKQFIQTELRQQCEERYGSDVFAAYIYPYYEDMLECIEHHVEDLGERSINDEELNY